MDIRALAEQFEDYIIHRRRWYHAHPEVSGEERETRAQIHRDLEEIGIREITDMQDCYGLTALIRGGRPGKTVALRTDIDALKITEETGLPYRSVNGSMHACGHDGHIAVLLGAARILHTLRDRLCGNVKLIVQPAEEIGKGGKWMVREGAMEGVDAIYGAHLWGELDAPYLDVTPGFRMAGTDLFKITVKGRAAHSSAPHLGIDAIAVAGAVIQNLQQCVSRMNDPQDPLVLTIGTINGGTRFNIIPNQVTKGITYTNHHEKFTIDEAVLKRGAALMAQFAVDYLAESAERG